MSAINKRLEALEQAIHADDLIELVTIEWGRGDELVTHTERMTREEYERRYPGRKPGDPAVWVIWD